MRGEDGIGCRVGCVTRHSGCIGVFGGLWIYRCGIDMGYWGVCFILAVGRFFELCLFTFFLRLKLVEKRKWSISYNRLFILQDEEEGRLRHERLRIRV